MSILHVWMLMIFAIFVDLKDKLSICKNILI